MNKRELVGEVSLVLECSGHEQGAVDGCRVVRKRGEVVLIGSPWVRRTDLTAHELLHLVFHRYVTLRSTRDVPLPLGHTGDVTRWRACSWPTLPRVACFCSGPCSFTLGVLHARTAYWWYDWMTPSWRQSEWKRLFAATNRWGTAGFLIFIGLCALVVGIARLA